VYKWSSNKDCRRKFKLNIVFLRYGGKFMEWKILETTDKEKFYEDLNKYKINGWHIHLETFGMDGNRCYIIISKGFDI
jgi:hypothetical protein